MSKVAVVRATPATILADIQTAMNLAGVNTLNPTLPTILKDNLSWHLPMPGANTTPWQLEGVIQTLQHAGFRELVAVENRTVVTQPEPGARLNKLQPVYEKYRIPVKYNFRDFAWIPLPEIENLTVLPNIFPEGIRIPEFLVGKNIIHLPTLKCHIYTQTTGAMKNAFGGLLDQQRHRAHSWIHETLVDLLRIQQAIHPGIFAVIDGTTAGNGPGPRTLQPTRADLILASADQVAIDAVGAWLMGFDPMKIPYIRMATEAGLGTGILGEIEWIGERFQTSPFFFTVNSNLAGRVGNWLWFGRMKSLQALFFKTPLVHAFIAASAIYHDRLWWPLKGKRLFKTWCAESPWGKLFEKY
jgi:uncharacterized protein (DUF362 family)